MANAYSTIPLDPEILSRTPPEVIELILSLLERIRVLEARVEELEAKLNQNSSNSNKPPSSDSAFTKRPELPKRAKKQRKRKGIRQQCLRPTELVELHPEKCSCGCRTFENQEPYYIFIKSLNCRKSKPQ
jgi:transposase